MTVHRTTAGPGRASRPLLFLGFALAIAADPISSVAYAIEAGLGELGGDLGLLLPTMGLVLAIILLVAVAYVGLVRRFPHGGGAAAATRAAFGERWSFLPVGALIVDFALTVAISIASAGAAIVAYVPAMAPFEMPLALGLNAVVAATMWFGHPARVLFALFTAGFVVLGSVVAAVSLTVAPVPQAAAVAAAPDPAFLAVLLAVPVAMALATGVEAPASAIGQLGQLDDAGRVRYARGTLLLVVVAVVLLTVGLAAAAVRLGIGVPPESADTTLVAEVARAAVSAPLFAAFQAATALLLFAAACSAYQAGPGLLGALADGERGAPVLPAALGRRNAFHTPYVALAVFAVASSALIVAAGADEQTLVLYYAVSVFLAFAAGLVGMAVLSHRDGDRRGVALNAVGATVVVAVLAVNATRGLPLVSLGAAVLIAAALHWRWRRTGAADG